MLEVPDHRPGKGPYLEQTHAICVGISPPQTDFPAGTIGLWPYAESGIFMRVFLFGLSPRRTDLTW